MIIFIGGLAAMSKKEMVMWVEGDGEKWKSSPFPQPAAALRRLGESSELASAAFEAFSAAYRARGRVEDLEATAKNRKLIAEVLGCPEDLVDDVIRVRLARVAQS